MRSQRPAHGLDRVLFDAMSGDARLELLQVHLYDLGDRGGALAPIALVAFALLLGRCPGPRLETELVHELREHEVDHAFARTRQFAREGNDFAVADGVPELVHGRPRELALDRGAEDVFVWDNVLDRASLLGGPGGVVRLRRAFHLLLLLHGCLVLAS